MRFIQTIIKRAWRWVDAHQLALVACVASGWIVAVWGFVFFSLAAPQHMTFSYTMQSTCIVSPKIIPGLFQVRPNPVFSLQRTKTISLGRVVLYSHQICASAHAQPHHLESVTSSEVVKGFDIISKPFRIYTPDYPKMTEKIPDKPIPVDRPLTITLTQPDDTFRYVVYGNGRTALCKTEGRVLHCDISGLAFEHAKKYSIQLVRTFRGKHAGIVAQQTIETLTPIRVTASSIPLGGTVYDKPANLTLETDKPIADAGKAVLVSKAADGKEVRTPLSAKKTSKSLGITLPELTRKTQYEVRLSGLHATDGSSLPTPAYVLPFYASGGPKVAKINTGTVKVAQDSTFVIAFDQPLAPTQNIAAQVSIGVNGKPQPAAIAIKDNTVSIKPTSALPFCATFTIQLTAGIQNPAGISGDSAWNFNGRAVCMTTFSIGTSVQGRAITGYRFGEGPNPIMYVGALHGNELSSKIVLDSWANELENNPALIATGRSVVVIPSMNPDGVILQTRVNANSVDLNRNFPANDWKSTVSLPGGGTTPNGGGTAPLSEPESRALANYIQAQRPRMVLSYHAVASLVEANEAGDSAKLAEIYCSTSKYRNIPRSRNYFTYDTTGAMEDWMRDKLGLPALVIELATPNSNEYPRNSAAMRAMLKL
jgi:murein peptide amidase A